MRTILGSALALGAMTVGAMAEPAVPTTVPTQPIVTAAVPMKGATARQSGPIGLTDAQMDKISAGFGRGGGGGGFKGGGGGGGSGIGLGSGAGSGSLMCGVGGGGSVLGLG